VASLRKRYQGRVEVESTSGGTSREPPRPSEELPANARPTNLKITEAAPPQPEQPVVESSDPVRDAERSAMRERLRQLENAEVLQKQAASHPQLATEPKQDDPLEAAIAPFPDTAKAWLRQHRELLFDPRMNAAMQHYHWIARDEAEEYSPAYFERLEHHLGLRPVQDGPNGQVAQMDRSPIERAKQTLNPQPQRQASAPVSAPVSRESPSWSSGRPASETTLKLTPQEAELAATIGITPQQYLEGKKRMLREKGEGYHDHGR
jgi:hypothetical protein